MIYSVENLPNARCDLAGVSEAVVLTNSVTAVVFYGVAALDYIFHILRKEFKQINAVIINVGESRTALVSAIQLGYREIRYNNITYNITDKVNIDGLILNII